MLPLSLTLSISVLSDSTFKNGTGMTEPNRNTMTTNSVKRIFRRMSGILQAFFIVLNNLDHLGLSAGSFNLGFRSFGKSVRFYGKVFR